MVEQVADWLERFPEAVMWDKEKKNVPFEARGVKTRTGLEMLGKQTQEYEWSAVSAQNAIYGMYHRHLHPDLGPDVVELERFR